jgi:hypothetical protein
MGTKLNIFTGQLDITGTGGGPGPSPVDPFSAIFNATTSWSGPIAGFYTITYTVGVHGQGSEPTVQVFEQDGASFNLVDVDRIQIGSTGDVEIRVPQAPDLRFAGKIIIS